MPAAGAPAQEHEQLWPLPSGGRKGACRTKGGNSGSFELVWFASEMQCQSLCAASSLCVAFEWGKAGNYLACELHGELVRSSNSHPAHRDENKDIRGSAVTALLCSGYCAVYAAASLGVREFAQSMPRSQVGSGM